MPTHRIAFQPIEYEGIAKPTIRILTLRGQRVVLDSDLAEIYGVSTGHFNEAVKRNLKRFPQDFFFVVTREEYDELISQNAILKPRFHLDHSSFFSCS